MFDSFAGFAQFDGFIVFLVSLRVFICFKVVVCKVLIVFRLLFWLAGSVTFDFFLSHHIIVFLVYYTSGFPGFFRVDSFARFRCSSCV